MARGFPAYREEMDRRGVKLAGRPLDIDEPSATVRVRDGETLVADGPFVETKEFVGGLDLLDCADLDEAIEVEGRSPVARFLPFEIRPFPDGVRLGAGAAAFGHGDDSAGRPYLLTVWVDDTAAASRDERAYDAWQSSADAQGQFILGNALDGPETATTLRFRDGAIQVSDGPFLEVEAFIAGIDIVSCADRQQAIELAAAHPSARTHAIEVRPFHSDTAPRPA